MHRRIRALRMLAMTLVGVGMLATLGGGTQSAWVSADDNAGNRIVTEALEPPTGVSGTVLSDGRTVRLTWTPTTTTSASGYRVYRTSSASGPWTLVDTIPGRTTTTVDQSPPDGSWHFHLRAYAGPWEGATSATAGPLATATLDHFEIAPVGEQHSGRPFAVTIRARSASNALVTGWAQTVALTTGNGTMTPTTTGTFSGGVRTETVTITGSHSATQTITANGGTPAKTGTSAAFTLHDWVFAFKKTTPASGTGCLGGTLRFREMAEGYLGAAPEEVYMRTAGEGDAEFCSPPVTSAITLPAGTTNVRAFMSNTAGSACSVTAQVSKGTTAIGSAVTLAIAPGAVAERVFAIPTPAIPLAVGDRLSVRLQWTSVKACNTTYLHYGGTTARSRVHFTG